LLPRDSSDESSLERGRKEGRKDGRKEGRKTDLSEQLLLFEVVKFRNHLLQAKGNDHVSMATSARADGVRLTAYLLLCGADRLCFRFLLGGHMCGAVCNQVPEI
jgi:hypothetical protein